MKLYGVTCVYNEEKLVPIVMPYLKKMGYDKLIVWDNESTDKTVELLKKYDFIEIRSYSTERFNELEKLTRIVDTIAEFSKIKNDEPDEQVWVSICDFDEVYNLNVCGIHFSFKDYLFWHGAKNYNVIREHLWCLLADGEKICYGDPLYWNKPNLFRLNGLDMDTFKLSVGQHDIICTYGGQEPNILYDTKLLSAFHLKYYNHSIFLDRQKIRFNRNFTENNHYSDNNEQNLSEYNEMLKLSIPYSDYLTDKILHGKEYVGRFLI